MKILAGILMSLYLGLTLFGLYQYKAHNRMWGMRLVCWGAALLLFAGVVGMPARPVGIRVNHAYSWRSLCRPDLQPFRSAE